MLHTKLFSKITAPGEKYSVIGWSDGGITALVLAADYGHKVNRLVVWGCNAFISEKDAELAESVRDVSVWSERMRKPMEEIYGVEEFPKFWSKWVDAYKAIRKQVITQFKNFFNVFVNNICLIFTRQS